MAPSWACMPATSAHSRTSSQTTSSQEENLISWRIWGAAKPTQTSVQICHWGSHEPPTPANSNIKLSRERRGDQPCPKGLCCWSSMLLLPPFHGCAGKSFGLGLLSSQCRFFLCTWGWCNKEGRLQRTSQPLWHLQVLSWWYPGTAIPEMPSGEGEVILCKRTQFNSCLIWNPKNLTNNPYNSEQIKEMSSWPFRLWRLIFDHLLHKFVISGIFSLSVKQQEGCPRLSKATAEHLTTLSSSSLVSQTMLVDASLLNETNPQSNNLALMNIEHSLGKGAPHL